MYIPAIIFKLLLLPIIVAVVASPLTSPESHKPDEPPPNRTIVKIGPFPEPPPPRWTMVKKGKGPWPKSAIRPDDPSWCKFVHGYGKGWVSIYSRDWGQETRFALFKAMLEQNCYEEILRWHYYPYGKYGAYATFRLPWIFVSDDKTRRCVADAYHEASVASFLHKYQTIECCYNGDIACAERDYKRYFTVFGNDSASIIDPREH